MSRDRFFAYCDQSFFTNVTLIPELRYRLAVSEDDVQGLKERIRALEENVAQGVAELKDVKASLHETTERELKLADELLSKDRDLGQVERTLVDARKEAGDLQVENSRLLEQVGLVAKERDDLEQEKRDFQSSFPTFVKTFLAADQFARPMGRVMESCLRLGRHLASKDLLEKLPNADPSLFVDLDDQAEARLQEADEAVKEASFPYLEQIGNSHDASLAELLRVEPA